MNYEELLNLFLSSGGERMPTDGDDLFDRQRAAHREISLPDGSTMSMEPSGRLVINRINDDRTSQNVTYVNPDGTTSNETMAYNSNRWQRSLLGALAVSLPFLGPTIASAYGLMAAAPGAAAAAPAAAGATAPAAAGAAPATLSGITSVGAPSTTGFALSGGTQLSALGAGGGFAAAADGIGSAGSTISPGFVPSTDGTLAGTGLPSGVPSVRPPSSGNTVSVGTAPGAGFDLSRLANMTPLDLASLLAGIGGSVQQRNYGQDLLERADNATPNRGFYEDQLRQSYEDPTSWTQGPEGQALLNTVHNQLQRRDAAGGTLANSTGRQSLMQDRMLTGINQYRTGLANIVGDNQRTYSGQNSMFQQGAGANNSFMNPAVHSLLDILSRQGRQ